MKNKVDLLTIGDVCIDLYLGLEDGGVKQINDEDQTKICFYHGNKIPVKTLRTNIAGNAVNVCLGATMLGLNTAIYTETGNDEEADKIENELKAYGVDTTFINKNKDSQTGIHPVIVYEGERTIFSHHEKRTYNLKDWPTPKWIYYTSLSPGFEKFQQDLVDYIKKNPGIGIAFNPGTYHLKAGVKGLSNILGVTDVLFVNRAEAEGFVGELPLEKLHKELQKLGPKLTIITEGKKGATGHDGKNMEKVKAYQIDKPLLDKTGAGDAFASGVISALNYNRPLQEALLWGAVNSSSVIREIGAIHGLKNKGEMEAIIQEIDK